MNIYTIYKIECNINGKTYIGFDSNYPTRIQDHLKNSLNNKLNRLLHKAIRKYGWDNFKYEAIYQSLDKDYCLNVMENYFISEYKSYYLLEDSHGYNMTLGGEGMPGYQHTPETKEKMKSADRHKTTGNLHYKHDDTVHHFINRETNEEAFMTQNDFFNTFKFPASAINAIIQGRFTSYKNWHIYGKETKYRVKGQNHHNYNPTTYTLIHKDTGVKISGTLRELVNELKLTHHANLRSVLKGDRQIAYGWMLYK